jgi:hypothetical protein
MTKEETMARKFEIGYDPGRYAWALEQCEEELLIVAYDEICRFIPADQTWKHSFENHFFDFGDPVTAVSVDLINVVRKRRGLAPIVLRETNVSDYGRSRDKSSKSNRRHKVREELKDETPSERCHRLERAKAEEQRLAPPHSTYEEYKVSRGQNETRSKLSAAEIRKRLLAEQAAKAAESTMKSTLPPGQAAKMLAIASQNLRGEIIKKLSRDDALEVAEKIEDAELRDALVKHSLEAA